MHVDLELNTFPENSKSSLTEKEIKEDIDTIIFALQKAYIGIDVYPEKVNNVIEKIKIIQSEAKGGITSDKLGEKIGLCLSEIPDGHISVELNKTEYVKKDREQKIWPIGENVGKDSPNGVWSLNKIKLNKKDISILSILNFPSPNDPRWDGLEDSIKKILQEDLIVFDLRGNTGGDSGKAKIIAQMLINNTVKHPSKTIIIKNTPYAHQIMINVSIFKIKSLRESGKSTEHIKRDIQEQKLEKEKAKDANKDTITLEHKHPNTDKLNFNGKIYVLADRNCGSSGEHALRLLKFHPNTTFIGEPTAGAIDFGQSGLFSLPNSGILVRVCTKYFVSFDGGIHDKTGYIPDINVSESQDALELIVE